MKSWGNFIPDEYILEELAEFFQRPKEVCLRRIEEYKLQEMATAWIKTDPKTPEEMRAFYSNTELYIWELTKWNYSESYQRFPRALDRMATLWPPYTHPRILDFGCGIGSVAIMLAEKGYQVIAADVPGKTLSFARHRFNYRGLPIKTYEILTDIPDIDEEFDLLVSFDVLEHIPNPVSVLRQLTRQLRPGGGAVIQAAFEAQSEEFPHHLHECLAQTWWIYLNWLGLDPVEDMLYYQTGRFKRLLRELRHKLWKWTGWYVHRIPRCSNTL